MYLLACLGSFVVIATESDSLVNNKFFLIRYQRNYDLKLLNHTPNYSHKSRFFEPAITLRLFPLTS